MNNPLPKDSSLTGGEGLATEAGSQLAKFNRIDLQHRYGFKHIIE